MITYRKGDATDVTSGALLHVVNDSAAWGAGFSGCVSKRWPGVEWAFRSAQMRLFQTQILQVSDTLWVCNMCAQRGLRSAQNPQPLSYEALEACLAYVSGLGQVDFHMPKIGAGLGGGHWPTIEAIINRSLNRATVWTL